MQDPVCVSVAFLRRRSRSRRSIPGPDRCSRNSRRRTSRRTSSRIIVTIVIVMFNCTYIPLLVDILPTPNLERKVLDSMLIPDRRVGVGVG